MPDRRGTAQYIAKDIGREEKLDLARVQPQSVGGLIVLLVLYYVLVPVTISTKGI